MSGSVNVTSVGCQDRTEQGIRSFCYVAGGEKCASIVTQDRDAPIDATSSVAFPAPPAGKYKVTVDTGDGHLAKTTITIPTRPLAVPSPTTSDGTASPSGAEPEVIVSDGPTRAETTGWRRWLMAGVGLAVIGLVFWGFWLLARRNGPPQATGVAG